MGIIKRFFLVFLFIGQTALAQDSTVIKLRSVADAVLRSTSFRFIDRGTGRIFENTNDVPEEAIIQPESPYNDWRYWNGVLNISMMGLGETLGDSSYFNYPVSNVEFGFDSYKYFEKKYSNEGKWNYPFGQFFLLEELDDGGAIGASVIEVYKNNPNQKYKEYIDKVADHMLNKQSRIDDGTLVRSFPNKWTLWADDLYMGLSFLSRMGEMTQDNKYFDFAAMQVINYNKYLFDTEKGLMTHCWFSDLNRRGTAFWGRANGWAMVAQVDLLDRLPLRHPKRDSLISLLQRHINGIAHYQGPDGLWHQLLDKTDSYYETSCSAMFTYAIARAVNKGYIDERYSSIAQRGWEGVMMKITPEGLVEGVCTGTVVSNDLVYYYRRPAPLNDVHGLGTIILAGTEVYKLQKNK